MDQIGNFLGARGRFGLEVKRCGQACLWWLWRWGLGAQAAVLLSAAPGIALASCTCLFSREGYGSMMIWIMARLLGDGFRNPICLKREERVGKDEYHKNAWKIRIFACSAQNP